MTAAHEKTVQLFEVFAQISQGSQKKLVGEIQKFVAALIRFRMSVESEEGTEDSFDLFTDPVELMNRCLQEVETLCHTAVQPDKGNRKREHQESDRLYPGELQK